MVDHIRNKVFGWYHTWYLVTTNLTFDTQTCRFLNAFWTGQGEKEAERVWNYVAKFNELDSEVSLLFYDVT